MRTIISWYCGFLLCCALLGLLSGFASAATGLDFATGTSALSGMTLLGLQLPAPNMILMVIAAALMATWARLRGLTPFQNA